MKIVHWPWRTEFGILVLFNGSFVGFRRNRANSLPMFGTLVLFAIKLNHISSKNVSPSPRPD